MSDLKHYGTPRHSGRYPWGSGKNPQRNRNFLQRARDLEAQGLSSTEIAKAFNMSTTQYRAQHSIAVNEKRKDEQMKVQKLKDKGWSNMAISRELGIPESTIRNYLNPVQQERATATEKLASVLKDQIESKPYLDVGKGVNRQLGVSDTQLKTAVEMLKQEGYNVWTFKVEQVTNPGKYTEIKVITKEDYRTTRLNQDKITSPEGVYFEDYGDVVKTVKPPVSVDSNRVQIRYAEQGGIDKDGVIELRKGVPDISLGNDQYAQVRIAVDKDHYLKGMAMYSDNLPDGVDILFNTNKHEGTDKMDVLKKMKDDPSNPFGAVVRQREYIDANGEKKQSAINIVNDDTDWEKWSKNLSAQFLSKQSPALAKQQLEKAYKDKEAEFKAISELTNPTVKKKLLESFADDCDSAAVHLKAAAFPRQATHVILPITSLKDNEVYAPNYNNGEEVALIRYPHGGVFEIPRLVVNNNNREGKSLLAQAAHAIGINAHVAQQLSGADFDGDTVVVIPIAGQKIKTSKDVPISSSLHKLKDFDPKEAYPAYEGMPKVGPANKFHKGAEMGKVSNLITDMTIKGASPDEIARAVRHSMVVIDAEKHNLNWQQSYIDNGIAALKEKYQGGKNAGASTLISKASSDKRVPEYKELTNVSKMTEEQKKRYLNGEIIRVPTGEMYEKTRVLKSGEVKTSLKPRLTKTSEMAYATDAHELSSGTLVENVYANHANKLKALANQARKEYLATPRLQMNPSAKEVYKEEVASLKARLNVAAKNSPLERQAQLIASKVMDAKIKANPDWDKDDIKKHKQIEINAARERVGSKYRKNLVIHINDREWEAIQSGAISDSTLSEILKYTDLSEIQKRATPRQSVGLSEASLARARTLLNMGKTQAEVADAIGVSVSTLNKELNGD